MSGTQCLQQLETRLKTPAESWKERRSPDFGVRLRGKYRYFWMTQKSSPSVCKVWAFVLETSLIIYIGLL